MRPCLKHRQKISIRLSWCHFLAGRAQSTGRKKAPFLTRLVGKVWLWWAARERCSWLWHLAVYCFPSFKEEGLPQDRDRRPETRNHVIDLTFKVVTAQLDPCWNHCWIVVEIRGLQCGGPSWQDLEPPPAFGWLQLVLCPHRPLLPGSTDWRLKCFICHLLWCTFLLFCSKAAWIWLPSMVRCVPVAYGTGKWRWWFQLAFFPGGWFLGVCYISYDVIKPYVLWRQAEQPAFP